MQYEEQWPTNTPTNELDLRTDPVPVATRCTRNAWNLAGGVPGRQLIIRTSCGAQETDELAGRRIGMRSGNALHATLSPVSVQRERQVASGAGPQATRLRRSWSQVASPPGAVARGNDSPLFSQKGQEAHMTPDETSANQPTDKQTSSDNARPTWTAPRITRFEVTRTLNGSGTATDIHSNARSFS